MLETTQYGMQNWLTKRQTNARAPWFHIMIIKVIYVYYVTFEKGWHI